MYPYDYMVIKSQLYKELFLANIHVTSDICGNLVILSPDTNCEYKIHINDRGLCFISVGKETKNTARVAQENGVEHVYSYDNNQEAIEKLRKILGVDDVVLVKASNSMNFKEIVENIIK